MHNWKHWLGLGILLMMLVACTQDAESTATPRPGTTAVPTDTTTPTETPEEETAVPAPTNEPDITNFTWPAPPIAYETLSRAPVTSAEQTTFADLEANYPPERDDVRLAIAYRGLTELPTDAPEPLEYEVGMREPLFILNTDVNTISSPDFELLHISDHAYFWFDTTPGLSAPSARDLTDTGAAFDQIYEQNTTLFGSEDNPGIDGNPRIHIVNASPLSVCDVTVSSVNQCGLGG